MCDCRARLPLHPNHGAAERKRDRGRNIHRGELRGGLVRACSLHAALFLFAVVDDDVGLGAKAYERMLQDVRVSARSLEDTGGVPRHPGAPHLRHQDVGRPAGVGESSEGGSGRGGVGDQPKC